MLIYVDYNLSQPFFFLREGKAEGKTAAPQLKVCAAISSGLKHPLLEGKWTSWDTSNR